MSDIYNNILASIEDKKRLLAVLIDPDMMSLARSSDFMQKVNASIATHIFVGGSTVKEGVTDALVSTLETLTKLPIILFPGDVSQITGKADALLFLSLISGRNPDYIIGKHVEAVSRLKKLELEVIPTGYILIENGKETSVQKVTGTKPIPNKNIKQIVDTAIAGQLLGMQLIYLEAGSGATNPVTPETIRFVKKELQIPLIVGGGIKSKKQLQNAYESGADMVVIGTAFEDDESFFNELEQFQFKTSNI